MFDPLGNLTNVTIAYAGDEIRNERVKRPLINAARDLVIIATFELSPCLTWVVITRFDIAKSPTNLCDRVGAPIG
jgi:hypothetical protein